MSVSQSSIARQLSISRTAVSHVLNGRDHMVGPETRKRILEAVEESGYQRNALVRALRTNRTHVVGIIVPEEGTSFFTEITNAAEREAQKHGLQCFLCQTHSDPDALEKQINTLREYRTDGILVAPSNDETGKSIFRDLQHHEMPFVLIDSPVNGVNATFVATENVIAGRLGIEHLLSLGHTRIACVRGYEQSWASRYRYEGYRTALEKSGIAIDEQLIIPGGFEFEAGREAVELLLKRKVAFTAVVAASDQAAMGVIQQLSKHGLQVPHDVSVVGCGNLNIAQMATPALTTVDQKPAEVGQRAMQLLIQQIESKKLSAKKVLIEPVMIVRESTCPPKKKAK